MLGEEKKKKELVKYILKYVIYLGKKKTAFLSRRLCRRWERAYDITAKDMGIIGHCLKRRMSAVKFRATWGWGSSLVMNLPGHSNECFWQNFMFVTLWMFLSKANKCHQSEKNTRRAFFTVKFLLKGTTRDASPCSNIWQNCKTGMTLPFTGATEQPEVTAFLSKPLPKHSPLRLAWITALGSTLNLHWRGFHVLPWIYLFCLSIKLLFFSQYFTSPLYCCLFIPVFF